MSENHQNGGSSNVNRYLAYAMIVVLILAGFSYGYGVRRAMRNSSPPPESELAVITESETESVEEVVSTVSDVESVSEPCEVTETESIVEPVEPAHIVCIDPGHQEHGMSETEPNGPGSSVMKAKLTTGTEGRATGKTEYEINLEIALKLRDELVSRGYEVVMTRETNDVTISNAERAVLAAEAGAEVFVRLHCNGSDNSSVAGVLCYQPSESNLYLDKSVIDGSQKLSKYVLDAQTQATGQKSLGVIAGDDMTGINWAVMPVTIVEMGFMSNEAEDRYMAEEDGQNAISNGIANGIDAFFAEAGE